MSIRLLLIILLIEGFITISIEILSIRQLIPFVGNSVVITSLVIGVFLLFLSIGYYRGGLIKANFKQTLSQNFIAAGLFSGIGLSYLISQCYFELSFYFLPSALFSLSIYLLCILAPTVYFLGQTIPITTNLFKKEQSVSVISSQALFISTLGSFFGATLTSLVLLNYLGVTATLVINTALLFLLSIITINRQTNSLFLTVCILSLCFIFIFRLNVQHEKKHFIKSNLIGNYQVVDDNRTGQKTLVINNAAMSSIGNGKSADYIEDIKRMLFSELKLQNKNILIIGAGGFTLSDNVLVKNNFDYIDIDNDIKKIAENYFLHHPINGSFKSQEARLFLNKTYKLFDVIFSDTYKSRMSIPSSLLTKDYFNQIKQHLVNEGIAVFNIIADPLLRDNFSKRVDNTINAVFPNCMKMPTHYYHLSNIIYLCTNTAKDKESVIYTDNLNTSALDQLALK